MLCDVTGQSCSIGTIDRKRRNSVQAVSLDHRRGRIAVAIRELHRVIAGFAQQAGNQCAYLPRAENQNLGHERVSLYLASRQIRDGPQAGGAFCQLTGAGATMSTRLLLLLEECWLWHAQRELAARPPVKEKSGPG